MARPLLLIARARSRARSAHAREATERSPLHHPSCRRPLLCASRSALAAEHVSASLEPAPVARCTAVIVARTRLAGTPSLTSGGGIGGPKPGALPPRTGASSSPSVVLAAARPCLRGRSGSSEVAARHPPRPYGRRSPGPGTRHSGRGRPAVPLMREGCACRPVERLAQESAHQASGAPTCILIRGSASRWLERGDISREQLWIRGPSPRRCTPAIP